MRTNTCSRSYSTTEIVRTLPPQCTRSHRFMLRHQRPQWSIRPVVPNHAHQTQEYLSSWCYERVTYTLVGGLSLTRLSLDLDVLHPVQDLSSCPLMRYRPSNSVRLVQFQSGSQSAKPVKRLHTYHIPSYLLEPNPLASGRGEENSPYREPPAQRISTGLSIPPSDRAARKPPSAGKGPPKPRRVRTQKLPSEETEWDEYESDSDAP